MQVINRSYMFSCKLFLMLDTVDSSWHQHIGTEPFASCLGDRRVHVSVVHISATVDAVMSVRWTHLEGLNEAIKIIDCLCMAINLNDCIIQLKITERPCIIFPDDFIIIYFLFKHIEIKCDYISTVLIWAKSYI